MARVKLKDGGIVDIDIDPTWGPDAVQRAIKEYKNKADRANDTWGEWTDKQVKSVVRGGGAGLSSTADLAKNFILDAPANAVDWLRGDPTRRSLSDSPVRDAYERNVIAQPGGYESTANVAEVAVPALVETALTGSPKTAFFKTGAKHLAEAGLRTAGRAGTDTALGAAGGYAGGEIGEQLGGEQGRRIGEIIGGAVGPAASSRTGARAASSAAAHLVGVPSLALGPFALKGLGRFDPFNLIPKVSPQDLLRRAPAGVSGAMAYDYNEDELARQQRLDEAERYNKMTRR